MTARPRIYVGVVALCGLLTSLSVAADRAPSLALINESPSLPRGLYVRSGEGVDRGAVVAFPQPVTARPYLSSLGMPGEVLLIKRVAAIGGDVVCADRVAVETPIGRYRILASDGRGRGLDGWRGCRALAADELFLLGDTQGSYDSRYFGPVQRAEVTGVFRETWTW